MTGASHSENSLVDLIYAALLGEASWQQFLDELTATVSDKAVLLMHGLDSDAGYIAVTSGLHDKAIEDYNKHYASLNVLQDSLGRQGAGISLPDDALYPREKLVRTEFYNDFFVPNQLISTVGLKIYGDKRRSYSLTTGNARRNAHRNRNAVRVHSQLAPHLKRAFDYYRKGSAVGHGREVSASLLDAIEVGVVVIGEDAKVKSISGVAQKMMEHQAAIAISSSEGLRLLDETAQAVLTSMLAWPYVGSKESSFFLDGKKLTLVSVTKDHIASYFEGPTVLLLMEEPKEATFDPAPFTLAFGLTKAETRALEAIVGGKSTDQLAKETRRSRETIRAQIKSLFAKTQTHSRENVLRLVQCDPLFRTLMHSRKDGN